MSRILSLFALFLSNLIANTITIPGDFSTIQAGIDASNDGDTILVDQGTYIENLILEKEIVLASHAINDDLGDWMSNENILNTIIIGNQPSNPKKGSCLQISYNDIEPTIVGFTFQDGLGTAMEVNDCDIYRLERSGGAILAYEAYPVIMYNRFINNGTSQVGGGNAAGAAITNGGAISHYDTDDVEFDEDRNRNERSTSIPFDDFDALSIYILENSLDLNDADATRNRPVSMIVQNNYFENNSSGNGESFYSHGYDGDIDLSGSIFEDIDCESGTVNDFVLHSFEEEADYVQNDISGACIEENIFYVSSENGDDNNPGTETDPLQSIRHALSLVKQNNDEVTTIYLNAGIYSNDRNGEVFPIVIPDNVHLIGDEPENTKLLASADVDNEAGVIIIKEVNNVMIANLTLKGGYAEGHGCSGGGGLLIAANDMFNLDTDNGNNVAPSYPVIDNVIIEENHSHNGGGLGLFRVNGPVLNDVIIRNNTATAFGGGVFSYVSTVTMTNVTITQNENLADGQGGGIMLAASQGTFDNMTITDNTGCCHGGGMWTNNSGGEGNFSSGWTMSNSTISGNECSWFGGGINFSWSHPILINCTISNNTGIWGGGGIDGLESGFTLKESIVSGNYSYGSGGGILAWGEGADPIIEDCIIIDNETSSNGGGIMINAVDEATIRRTSIIDNHADNYAGGLYVLVNDLNIENITASGNTSNAGGVLAVNESASITLTNSIVWNNDVQNDILTPDETGSFDINYSNIENGFEGVGNIDTDPFFTDPSNNDYTLSTDSPCIDAGTADTDNDGNEDITDYSGIAPDMGAFETTIAAPAGFNAYLMDDHVILTWEAPSDQDVQYYHLERSTDIDFMENIESNYLTLLYYEDHSLEYDTEFFYRLSYYSAGWSEYSDILSITLEGLNVDGNNQLPARYSLHQNYPNPFNPITNLAYDLPEDSKVTVQVYDMMGKSVRVLASGQQSAGYKTLQWDATNQFGESVSAGVYIYTIRADNFRDSKKMILLK